MTFAGSVEHYVFSSDKSKNCFVFIISECTNVVIKYLPVYLCFDRCWKHTHTHTKNKKCKKELKKRHVRVGSEENSLVGFVFFTLNEIFGLPSLEYLDPYRTLGICLAVECSIDIDKDKNHTNELYVTSLCWLKRIFQTLIRNFKMLATSVLFYVIKKLR